MRVIIYTRVSNDRFGDERSPERQEAACRAYAASRDWTVVEAYRDVDASAYKPMARPGYDRVVSEVRAGTADAVVVWKLDRLVRRSREFEQFWAVCESAGAALVSVTEPIDTSTELGLAIVRVLVTFAALESATKSVRLKAANRDLAMRGLPHQVPGRAFGYTADWSVVPEEAALVREAAHRILAGETMAEVVRDWTLQGRRTPKGALWSVHRMRDLLLSPRLWGMRVYHGEVVAEGTWPAILDPETGARLQYLLADPSRRREPRGGRPSLLSGLLRCGRCGSRMVTRRSSRGPMSYCCPSLPRGCNGVGARQDGVDAVVQEAVIRELERRRDFVPDVVAQRDVNDIAASVARHAQALKQAADDYYVRKAIDRSVFLSVRDSLDRSLHEETAGGAAQRVPAQFRRLLAKPRLEWPRLTNADKRSALRFVVDHVVIHPAPRSSGRFRPERVEVVLPGQRVERVEPPGTRSELDPKSLLTTGEAAAFLDVYVGTVVKMIRSGALPASKPGKRWLITGADVQRLRDERNRTAVKRVRRANGKFAEILREYNNAGAGAQGA